MTIVRIDVRRISDSAGLHAILAEAFGFPAFYGKNRSALVDCLTYLDDPKAGMSKVQVFPGELVLLAVEHVAEADGPQLQQLEVLADVVAFVNWRRLQQNEPPVLAMAYARSE